MGRSSMIDKLIWYLKQLLPLFYVTTFTENSIERLCIFRMWFGHWYNIRYYDLKGKDIKEIEKQVKEQQKRIKELEDFLSAYRDT